MKIQARDRMLLERLSRYGVLSTQQLQSLIFPGVAHTTVMRRLRKLERESMILRAAGLPDSMSVWCLSKEAGRLIGKEDVPRYANRNIIEHEVMLSALRMALEAVGFGNDWVSEREMRKRMGYRAIEERENLLIPDGLFVASRQGKPCVAALELELHAKNHARYDSMLRRYQDKESIGFLWYVVPELAIAETLFKRWKRRERHGKLVLAASLLRQLLQDPAHSQVWVVGEKPVSLGDLFDLPNAAAAKSENRPVAAQGVSREREAGLSTPSPGDLQQNHALPSAPPIPEGGSSTADYSPSTLHVSESSRQWKGRDEEERREVSIEELKQGGYRGKKQERESERGMAGEIGNDKSGRSSQLFFEKSSEKDLGFDRLVSRKKAAELLDVSVKFVYECIARREIQAVRVGGRLRRIRLSTLETWLSCKN